mmetsp:Transcript_528/g.2159  ORF Transcript_528/g.2159 Transcript_528/m.2159 type:complete len:285 (+) Transcript_528:189-1043(+)
MCVEIYASSVYPRPTRSRTRRRRKKKQRVSRNIRVLCTVPFHRRPRRRGVASPPFGRRRLSEGNICRHPLFSHLAGEHGVRLGALQLARAAGLAGEVRDAVRLLGELLLRDRDALPEPVVDLEALHDLVRAVAGGAAGHGEDDALRDAVRVSVRAHRAAEPVALLRGRDQRLDGVRDGHGGGRRRRAPPLFDEQTSARLNRRRELVLQPRLVADHVRSGLPVDARVDEIRHLRRGVVAPDGDVGNRLVEHAGFQRELALSAVLVQTSQGVEVFAIQVGRVLHRD